MKTRSTRFFTSQATRLAGLTALAVCLLASSALQAAPLVPTAGPALNRSLNLLSNGSFEDDYSSFHYWATGTTLGPYSPIQNWTSQGGTQAYAWRTGPAGYASGSHGNALLYFGNQFVSSVTPQPAFQPNGTVTFSSAPTIVTGGPGYSPAVTLKQTAAGLIPGATYALSFWSSGEGSASGGYGHDGIFGLDVTGFNTTYLAAPDAAANSIFGTDNHTYRFDFVAPASSLEFKFTNWGHFFINNSAGQVTATTELVMDDVILNLVKVPEPASIALLGLGGLFAMRRRARTSA